MANVYSNHEIAKEFSSSTPPEGFGQGASASKSARCQGCGRDLSQPNPLPPSISRSCAKPQGISRGHAICVQFRGLGAGLLDGIGEKHNHELKHYLEIPDAEPAWPINNVSH